MSAVLYEGLSHCGGFREVIIMAREHTVDIHDYQHKFLMAERAVHKSTLSARNKQLILRYRDVCLRQGLCGKVRLIRVMGALTLFGRMIGKDFDTLDRVDIEDLVSRLVHANPPYSPETLGTYKAILKKFLTWVIAPNDFPTRTPPAMVAWLTCHVRAKDKRRLQRRDLLTPEEAELLLTACSNARDRALVSLLWETGGRVAEIGNLQIKHLTKTAHGYLLDVEGKTGARNPLVVGSAPAVTAWLAYHPFRNNPDAPLWVYQYQQRTPHYLRYQTIRKLLQTLFVRASITKRPNPHGFRHARTTHLVGSGLMNESMAKSYLGWSPTSKMLGTYAHLTTSDANNAILSKHHLAPTTECSTSFTVRHCTICQETNPQTARFCLRCNNPLDPKAAYENQQTSTQTQTLLLQLCKVLVEKGLLDEAADQIHKAGLGPALKALATPPKDIGSDQPV